MANNIFSEFDSIFGVSSAEEPAPAAQRHQPTAQASSAEDEELLSIERKLVKAKYYLAIVQTGVIEEDGNQETAEINAESRLWARQQMAKLVGQGPAATTEKGFSEAQVAILKKIADRVLAGQSTAGVAVAPVEQKPVVKVLQAQRRTPKKTTASNPSPVAPQSTVQRQPQQTSGIPTVPQDATPEYYDSIPEGKVFRDKDGKLYKFRPHPTLEGQRVKLSAQTQVSTPKAIPMPKPASMEAIVENQTRQAIDLGATSNTNFPDLGADQKTTFTAIAHSLKGE